MKGETNSNMVGEKTIYDEKIICDEKIIYKESYLDGSSIKFEQEHNGCLNLHIEGGRTFCNIKPYRLLPISNKNSYIRLCSEHDEEIGILKDIGELEPESQKLLLMKLEEYYKIPKIKKIKSIENKYGIAHWVVETDAGDIEFDITNKSSDIKVFPGGRILLRDSDDNVYEITDYTKLPRKSYLKIQGEL